MSIYFLVAGFLFFIALLLLGLERGDKVKEAILNPRLNTNNCHRRRLLFDLDLCWLRDAQSLPHRAGARVALIPGGLQYGSWCLRYSGNPNCVSCIGLL